MSVVFDRCSSYLIPGSACLRVESLGVLLAMEQNGGMDGRHSGGKWRMVEIGQLGLLWAGLNMMDTFQAKRNRRV